MANVWDGELSALEDEARRQEEERERLKPKQQEKDHVTRWHERIARAKKHDRDFHKSWALDRKVASGDTGHLVEANLIGSIMEVLMSFLYAKDPDLIVRPSESVAKRHRNDYKHFARTVEIVVSRLFKQARLKKCAKRWVRGSMTVGVGWIKAAMQTRIERDPIIEAQINDLQEQLENIDAKRELIEEGSQGQPEENVLKSEIESNLQAAEAKLERVLADGLVLDFMHPEHVQVAPECGEVENYLMSPWICFDTYKTDEQVLAITGWTGEEVKRLEFAARYNERRKKDGEINSEDMTTTYVRTYQGKESDDNEEAENAVGFMLVREIWCLTDGVVYTIIDGINDHWARKPYVPFTGARFYPCFQLAFHYVDGLRYPQSETQQLRKLQDEYASIRSDYRKHRERARPGIIFDQTAISEDSVRRIAQSTTQEFIPVEGLFPDRSIDTIFRPKNYNQVDPGLYDTTVITREMEKISGVQDALQASVQVEKTATEARIQETGFGARTGTRRDMLDEVLSDLSEYTAQLALQIFDQAQAEKYAGEGAVWIPMNTEQVMNLFEIEIKAGSTGKPRKDIDREAWGVLLPFIQEMIEKIGQAKAQGMDWAVGPWKALMRETFNRLDDHADLEDFIPEIPPEVVAALAEQQKDPLEESEVELNEAKRIETTAKAVETLPVLGEVPEVQELLGIPDEAELAQEAMAALQGQQGNTSLPPEPVT